MILLVLLAQMDDLSGIAKSYGPAGTLIGVLVVVWSKLIAPEIQRNRDWRDKVEAQQIERAKIEAGTAVAHQQVARSLGDTLVGMRTCNEEARANNARQSELLDQHKSLIVEHKPQCSHRPQGGE